MADEAVVVMKLL